MPVMTTQQLDPPNSAFIADPPHRTAHQTTAQSGVWLGFIVVLAASVMDLLDSTIAQTAAPAIRADLTGSYTDLEWISAAYTLAMSIGLLVGGASATSSDAGRCCWPAWGASSRRLSSARSRRLRLS